MSDLKKHNSGHPYKKNLWMALVTCFLGFFLGLTHASAQNSVVSGHLTDSKGSSVAKATVEIRNVATGLTSTASTNDEGYYLLPPVAPGSYVLHAGADTFSEATVTNLSLEVGGTRTVDIVLQPAQTTQTVTIEATAPELVTDQPDRGNVIESKFVQNIPLNIRNPLQMVNFAQGVTPFNSESGNNDVSSTNTNTFHINGGQATTTDNLLDGAANTFDVANSVISILTVDAIQEFKVLTTAYAPEWGRTSGAVVTFATRPGTNQLHGSVWEYLRNSVLDANGFNADAAGTPKPTFQRNQFGYALGGPVVLPRLYNGHNRTFFFNTYEGLRQSEAGSYTGTVPTVLERQGDFSQTRDANGNLIVIYDPRSTMLDPTAPAGTTQYIRTPFLNNKIPSQYLDTVGMSILNNYPLPNQPGEGSSSVNNFFSNATSHSPQNTVHLRIDQQIGKSHNIFGRFDWFDRQNLYPNYYGNGLTPQSGNETLFSYGWMVQDAWAINSSTVFTHHYSYAHIKTTRTPPSEGFNATSLGFNSNVTSGLQYTAYPEVTATRLAMLGPTQGYENVAQNVGEYAADVSHLKSKHMLKFGFDYRYYPTYSYLQAPLLTVTATSNFTGGPNPQAAIGDSGSGAADLLLGASTVSNGIAPPVTYSHPYFAFYGGDEYHITPKLTINYGLRYSLDLPYTEAKNQLIYLDLTSPSPLNSQVTSLGNLTGGPGFVGTNGLGRGVQTAQKTNFDPRVGFAYQEDTQTVIRAGFGIFHAPMAVTTQSIGYASTTTSTPAQPNGVTPLFNQSNPFPQGLVQPSGNSLGLVTQVGQNITGAPRQEKVSYSEQWSLDIQRQLPGNFVVTLGYVGNNGLRLYSQINYNQLPDADLSLGTQLLNLVPNPFSGVITDQTSVLSKPTVQYGQLLRPHPQFQNMTQMEAPVGQSTYHALQLSVEHRFSSGLAMLFAYTHSKIIDNTGEFTILGFQDNYCTACDRSISAHDLPNVIRLSGQYELPVGKGKRFVHDGWLVPIIGGWSVGSFFTYDDGLPIAVTSPNNSNSFGGGIGGNGMRPDVTGISTHVVGGRQIKNGGLYFNPAAFTPTPTFQFGNAPRYLADVRSPGTLNFDMLASKRIPIHNLLALDFRAEFFNAFNHVQFAGPNASISSSSFGQIFLNQTNTPRQIQGSLRLSF
jgi:hypothetical protein